MHSLGETLISSTFSNPEVGAIKAVYGVPEKRKENPLVLGALKSNIGHLEGAAGVAALCKVSDDRVA